jgi:uncharacterized membrane protein
MIAGCGRSLLVVVLTGYHHALGIWRKGFAAERNVRDQRFYRLANECRRR